MAKDQECLPLLKFDSDEEQPRLCEAGLAALASLAPPVSIVTFLGDGRCGKSTLASRLIDDVRAVFPVGDTGVAVTVGIDLCVVTRGAEGTLVVLDCEGGNNPTGAIRGAVDLVAMLASTLTVQVVWGQMSEVQFVQIGQSIADRDRLLLGDVAETKRLPEQRLLLAVNGCHLRYSSDHLKQAFLESHGGSASSRNELRANIKKAFPHIQFKTVPIEKDASYTSQLEEFRRDVYEQCCPAALAGTRLSGAQVAEMMKSTVASLRQAGVVPVPSVFRHVIFDHMLKPLVNRLVRVYQVSLPDLTDGDYRPSLHDTRNETFQAFDAETQQLTHSEFVVEARDDLRERIDAAWTRVFEQNLAIGEQDRDVSTESEMRYSHTEERVVAWKRSCVVLGKKTPVVEACSVFRVWTRTRVLKKSGQVAYSEWQPSAHQLDGNGCNMNGVASTNSSRWNSMTSSYGGAGGFPTPRGAPAHERCHSPPGPILPQSQSLTSDSPPMSRSTSRRSTRCSSI